MNSKFGSTSHHGSTNKLAPNENPSLKKPKLTGNLSSTSSAKKLNGQETIKVFFKVNEFTTHNPTLLVDNAPNGSTNKRKRSQFESLPLTIINKKEEVALSPKGNNFKSYDLDKFMHDSSFKLLY